MKIYISGKITDLPYKVAEQNFRNAAERITAAGHEPINPMVLVPYVKGWTHRDYIRDDIYLLLDCDAILMLSNWRDSLGARIEHAVAIEKGLDMFYDQNHNIF